VEEIASNTNHLLPLAILRMLTILQQLEAHDEAYEDLKRQF